LSGTTRKKSKKDPAFASLEIALSHLSKASACHTEKRKTRREEWEAGIITPNDITLTVSSFEYMLARCRAEYCSLFVASGLDLEQETQLHTHTPTLPASSNFG
jgi:hypothetical protein